MRDKFRVFAPLLSCPSCFNLLTSAVEDELKAYGISCFLDDRDSLAAIPTDVAIANSSLKQLNHNNSERIMYCKIVRDENMSTINQPNHPMSHQCNNESHSWDVGSDK